KSNSFNFPNGRSKTKLVDDLVLQRQKSAKERTSHEAREMGKSSSFRSNTLGFRSNNLRRFGESGSKFKMLSPNSSHVQDLGSLKNKKERNFERSNSVKTPSSNLGAPCSTALTPRGDKLTVSSASNAEAKSLKVESRMLSGTKSNSRSTNIGTEVPVSAGMNILPSGRIGLVWMFVLNVIIGISTVISRL
nr:RING/FYVE/PHD zinc finger superfamily protein, putative isoform 2 [Tanacetum cinerariifolium]